MRAERVAVIGCGLTGTAALAPLLGERVADLVEGDRPDPRFAFRTSPATRTPRA